jgi:2-C-methyl-D-erythritol 2,4-cyclodiphosphate synthase
VSQQTASHTRLRVGQGFDTHAFEVGRPLRLGGVEVPDHPGLAGHSDGDALLHAVIDAFLGATGLGDIGERFPSDDPRHAGADSRTLLKTVIAEVTSSGWLPVNLDVTVITQTPRLSPYTARMRQQLAELLGLPFDSVSVKAKSTDHLGALGRGEGLAALAVALVERRLLSSSEQ